MDHQVSNISNGLSTILQSKYQSRQFELPVLGSWICGGTAGLRSVPGQDVCILQTISDRSICINDEKVHVDPSASARVAFLQSQDTHVPFRDPGYIYHPTEARSQATRSEDLDAERR